MQIIIKIDVQNTHHAPGQLIIFFIIIENFVNSPLIGAKPAFCMKLIISAKKFSFEAN